MPENSALTQLTQIGVETTPGTAVAAPKLLQSLGFTWSPQLTNRIFRPTGQKYGTVAAKGRDWTQLGVTGVPTFDEIVYPLSSILGAAVVTTPDATNAPTARLWTFSPSNAAEDAVKTFTIEAGNATRARRAAYMLFSALNLNIGRDNVELGGSAMARRIETGITLTASPTGIPLVPILGDQFSIYSDATSAGLGTTKLLRTFAAEWGISDKVGGVWPLDAAQTSYAAHVETDPDPTLTLRPMADSVGESFLADLRAGTKRFIRLEAAGPSLGGTVTYRLRIDMAVLVREVAEYSEDDGVFVSPYTFEIVNDTTWGRPLQVAVTNTLSAL